MFTWSDAAMGGTRDKAEPRVKILQRTRQEWPAVSLSQKDRRKENQGHALKD